MVGVRRVERTARLSPAPSRNEIATCPDEKGASDAYITVWSSEAAVPLIHVTNGGEACQTNSLNTSAALPLQHFVGLLLELWFEYICGIAAATFCGIIVWTLICLRVQLECMCCVTAAISWVILACQLSFNCGNAAFLLGKWMWSVSSWCIFQLCILWQCRCSVMSDSSLNFCLLECSLSTFAALPLQCLELF